MRGIVSPPNGEEESGLRRGPWTREEDNLLIRYIAQHGEGRWNLSAKCAGLKRTGKSCRLRWLNYLKPNVKRGNLSPQEQLLILELHYKWGNRWSKIAQQLPGRTDNEIKNYWRTRVQKQARQLNVESNSKRFLDAVRLSWMPRLLQKANCHHLSSSSLSVASSIASPPTSSVRPPTHDVVNQGIPSYYSSPDLGRLSDQPDNAEGLARANENVDQGFSVNHQIFDASFFDNMGSPDYSIDDVVAVSALGNSEAPSFSHVGEVDIMGHATEDGFWSMGGLW